MKSKRKLITALITVTIVALATLSFAGCNGVSSVSPVDNTQFVKKIDTAVWNEGATRYDNFERNNPNITNSELTGGSPFARYREIALLVAKNVFDGYEVFQIEFDIVADRDVVVTVEIYYGGGNEKNCRFSAEISLKANEKVHKEWDLTKNISIANGDKTSTICIQFKGEPTSGTQAFEEWSQTQYQISNLEFYAVENE